MGQPGGFAARPLHRPGRPSSARSQFRPLRMLPRRHRLDLLPRYVLRPLRLSGGVPIELRGRRFVRQQAHPAQGVEEAAGVRRRTEGPRAPHHGAREEGRVHLRVRRRCHQEGPPRVPLRPLPGRADALHHGSRQRRVHRRAEEGRDRPLHQPLLRAQLHGRPVEGPRRLPRLRLRHARHRRRDGAVLRLQVDPQARPGPDQMPLRGRRLPRNAGDEKGRVPRGRGARSQAQRPLEGPHHAESRQRDHQPRHQGLLRRRSGVLRRRRRSVRRADGEASDHLQVRSVRCVGGPVEAAVDDPGSGV
mmetsp:Transcript_10080/g.28271  ORF Transcript_10080/g.28271 Transcript_10080/m.28271 type:complete len:304 (-) Transcript_10080:2322-3233(-)